jgi:cation diffusion facilitator family transporter
MSGSKGSHKVIYTALAGNLAIALTKFIAAGWTGSSAMMSEGVHSLVDTGNQMLLLYGIHRAARPPDEEHPLGYGRELYFWSFIVALLVFALGAGISFYEGVNHIRHPAGIENPAVNYAVLGLAFVFESASWFVAFREFEATRGSIGYLEAAIRSRDPTSFMVLFEDSAALIGIIVAFAGTFAAATTDAPIFDGIASVGIALVLAATAGLLAHESKSLLIGEPVRERTRNSILAIAREQPYIEHPAIAFTVHLAPDQVLVALELTFSDRISAWEAKHQVRELDRRIKERHSEVLAVFFKLSAGRTSRA